MLGYHLSPFVIAFLSPLCPFAGGPPQARGPVQLHQLHPPKDDPGYNIKTNTMQVQCKDLLTRSCSLCSLKLIIKVLRLMHLTLKYAKFSSGNKPRD